MTSDDIQRIARQVGRLMPGMARVKKQATNEDLRRVAKMAEV